MFKFKSFKSNNKPSTTSSSSAFDDNNNNSSATASTTEDISELQQQQNSTSTSSSITTTTKFQAVQDSYKPVADPNLTQEQRFKRELEQCAEDEGKNDISSVDFDNFGKNFLEITCGIQNGAALKEGGRAQQYAPKSVGGFATSKKAVHNSAELKAGDAVILLAPDQVPQKPAVVPISQKPFASNNKDAPVTTTASQQQQKPIEFISEDADDEGDDSANNADELSSVIGKNGGFILKSDKTNCQIEFCGSGKIETFPKLRLRPATEGEGREIIRLRGIRKEKQSANNNSNTNNNKRGFGFFGAAASITTGGGGPSAPSNSADSSWFLFDQLRVMKKKTKNENQQNRDDDNADLELEEEDDDVEGQQELVVTAALDNGKKAKLSSGETLSIDELEPVPPQFPRTKAVVVVRQQQQHTLPLGSLVLVERIDRVSGKCTVKTEDGTSGVDIDKKGLCLTTRR